MKITQVRSWRQAVPLTRPYTIAYKTTDTVDLLFVEVVASDGSTGLGSASPAPYVTGESIEACTSALDPTALAWLVGQNPKHLGALTRAAAEKLASTPAAHAAIDMALYDLFGCQAGVPVVDLLGRCHQSLPTSITIGIQSVEETLADANEYLERGFRNLKVKIGNDLDGDGERLARLRDAVGPDVKIRVDANQGYTVADAEHLGPLLERLDLEFFEQPLAADDRAGMRALPASLRQLVAADESLHTAADALDLARPDAACGIYNIKLMKCGGIRPALDIATVADLAGIELMWGCMDESVISIAAALHAAFACPATRYIDLDGSFDLARDVAMGGFALQDGIMTTLDQPGLGVSLTP